MRQLLAASGVFIAFLMTAPTFATAETTSAKPASNIPPYSGPHAYLSHAAAAHKAPQLYFFSYNAKAKDAPVKLVSATRSTSEERPSPVQGCDGVTYFLSDSDAAAVNSAIAGGDTVQLETAPITTKNPVTLCVVQAEH